MEQVDVIVVGAGFGGLSAAKSYLQCAPETKLVILDAYDTLGGTWAQQRLYPTVRTNNQYGTFEFPDFPMHEGYGVTKGKHIPGQVVHRYLTDYADNFGLLKRMRCSSKALSAEKLDDGRWKLHVKKSKNESGPEEEYDMICVKLILATGLTSQPESFYVKGQENFGAPIINSSQFATKGVEVIEETPQDQRRVTVMGGSKSAYDAVYMFAVKGFEVNWVIRKSGYGPTWMAPSHLAVGPKKIWLEQVPCTRILSWFSPCLLGKQDGWIRSFLHGTRIGNLLVRAFWGKFDTEVVGQSDLRTHPELEKLIPDESCFWYATSLAILNYDQDIHDFVRSGQVKIYREDVAELTAGSVHLTDGTKLPSQGGLVTAAKWQWAPSVEIKPASLHADLGIPSSEYSDDQKEFWGKLDDDADRQILKQFPMLTSAPQKGKRLAKNGEVSTHQDGCVDGEKYTMEQFRLYRFLASPNLDRSIAFQGYVANLINHVRNEVAGLWIYAYLNDKLDIDPKTTHYDTALQNRYWKWRYPMGFGGRFPDFVFEQLPYYDQLLEDLGISCRRKSSWFKEIFEPYAQAEYRGITAEWLEKNQHRANGTATNT